MNRAEKTEQLFQRITKRFTGQSLDCILVGGEITLEIKSNEALPVFQALRDEFSFEQLIDLCGVDYQNYGVSDWDTEASATGFSRAAGSNTKSDGGHGNFPSRFAVVYHLLSLTQNLRLRVRVYAQGEIPIVKSVIEVWNVANWFEREAFDLYGILFEGHPDLRRILTDYGFIGHPFRKDFPLFGTVEMRYDPTLGRVVYEPVQIEERILVPRTVREDNRFIQKPAQ